MDRNATSNAVIEAMSPDDGRAGSLRSPKCTVYQLQVL